jgi:hypothetical protein
VAATRLYAVSICGPRDLMLTSGFVPVSTNRGQSKLDAPSIAGIVNDTSNELDVHLTSVTNAYGYEVQISTNGTDWKTVKYSQQARTVIHQSQEVEED